MIRLSELVNLLFENPSEPASKAAKEAQHYGLEYVGWGMWINKHGARVARSADGGEKLQWLKGVDQKNYQSITHNADKKTPGYKKYDNPVSQQTNKAGYYEPHSKTATVKGKAGGPEPVTHEPGYSPNAADKDPDSPWNIGKQSMKLKQLPPAIPGAEFFGNQPEAPKSATVGVELRPWPKTPQQRDVFTNNTINTLAKTLNGKLRTAQESIRGLRQYTTSTGADIINKFLRKGQKSDIYGKEYLDRIPHIDKAFELVSPLPDSILVFRGTSVKSMLGATSQEHALKRLQEFKTSGAIIHDKGFVSTSTRHSFAADWKNNVTGVLFNIQVPKGAKAITLTPLEATLHSHEDEVLLPRNCQFKIHDFRKTPHGIEVDLECIPPGGAVGDTSALPQQHQTKGHAENILRQKISGTQGTHAGGTYKGKDGKVRYVKLYKDPAQSYGEVLANELYKDLGISAPNSQYFESNEGVSFASELADGAEPVGTNITPDIANEILNGFLADAVLSNWDVVGHNLQNVVKTKDGKIMRIDNGSALLTKGLEGRKDPESLTKLTELDIFPQKEFAPIFQAAGIKSFREIPSLMQQYAKMRELRLQYTFGAGDAWKNYIDEKIPDAPEEIKQQMANSLTAKTKQAKKLIQYKDV